MPLDELVSRAKTAFRETQNGMQSLAALVARENDFAETDYRQVIRELKKEQLVGEVILSHYQERIAEVERIILREDIVSLPERALQFRLAGEEESAALPGPALRPPPLIGASESRGEIILPLRLPDAEGESRVGDGRLHLRRLLLVAGYPRGEARTRATAGHDGRAWGLHGPAGCLRSTASMSKVGLCTPRPRCFPTCRSKDS